MRRFWIGIVILGFLLINGIVLTIAAGTIHRPICRHLEQASEAALAEDWAQAETLTAWAEARWKNYRGFTAAFADHGPMEQIDSGFEEMGAFLRKRDVNEFSAACAGLARLAQAMADSQSVAWWNLL